MSHTTKPCVESVTKVLLDICEFVKQQKKNEKHVETLLRTLTSISNPQFTMDLIAPCLFLPLDGDDTWTTSEYPLNSKNSLFSLSFLASTDPGTYLKPASYAVLAAANKIDESKLDWVISDDLLSVIVNTLSVEDIIVTFNASESISVLAKQHPPIVTKAIPAIYNIWTRITQENSPMSSTISIRCASTIADLCIQGNLPMQSASSCGASEKIIELIADTSDPLMQMSALDVLDKIINTLPMHQSRAQWVLSEDVFKELLLLSGGIEGKEADPILGGSALRTLSNVCKLGHRNSTFFGQSFLSKKRYITDFRRALLGFDTRVETNRLAIIDAVSSFASASSYALSLIMEDSTLCEGWLSLSVAQPKLKSVILNSVARVIDPVNEMDVGEDEIELDLPTNEQSLILFKILGKVNNKNAMDVMMYLSKKPIVETRLGAYALMTAIAKIGMDGCRVLLSHSEFYNFLVEREREFTKEGKEAKFEILQAVLSSGVKGLLADNIVTKLEEVLKEGPYYVRAQPLQMESE